MRNTDHTPITHPNHRRMRSLLGAGLVTIGLILLIEQNLHTGWLTLILMPTVGFLLVLAGIRFRQMNLVTPGALVGGIGFAVFFIFYGYGGLILSVQRQVAIFLIGFGAAWITIALISTYIAGKTYWWALVPGSLASSLGMGLMLPTLNWIILAFYGSTALGIALALWGVSGKYLGLIIPGCLLGTLGPGLYLAWGKQVEPTALSQTGVLLVTFAMGWGLITLFSRAITAKFLWWPLIPGSVLAIVGWGLYIGGNPGNAVNFMSNTGSMGLVIFGLYLLLWNRGFHK